MADKTITQLTATTSAATADEIPLWVAGSAVTRKITKANFLQGAFTGGGTVATGGYTLTVPATGTAALLATANVFTVLQTINAAAGDSQRWQYSGTTRARIEQQSNINQFVLEDFDNGSSFGSRIIAGRNSNASTPAAGHLRLVNLGGTAYRIWPDTAGNVRIGTADPTNANDTSGTVIGTQTSMAAAKHLFDDVTPIGEVLASIQQAATAAVRRFTYRSGAYNGEAFEGVVTDLAPRYGMDRDDEHPAGKSLNEITLLGDLLRAVAHLAERVAALER